MRGPHCIRTWSSTQGPVALSSAEAEYYAMVDGATKALGVQAMAVEVGIGGVDGPIRLHTDSSSAKSFASRRGLGPSRHGQTRPLWLQQAVAEKRLIVVKVPGVDNPADVLTKFLSKESTVKNLLTMNIKLSWRPRAEGHRPRGGVGVCPSIPQDVRRSGP